jgi:hypothetical protein
MKLHTCTGPNCFGCRVKTLSVQSGPVFREHYNWSVGQYVNNDKEYRDALKKCGERNSIATGLDHDYQPRYPGETSPIREADGVFDDTARNLRKLANE